MNSLKAHKLEALKKRFDREVLELECEIITPMFLGDARQKPVLRPEPFKGLLRYWWRIATAGSLKRNILDIENKIFGGAGGENWGQSLIKVEVKGTPSVDDKLPSTGYVYHPEVKGKINPLLYLGYGPVMYSSKAGGLICNRSYLAPGSKFTIKLTVSTSLLKDDEISECFKRALYYFRAFGTAGSRSRNGWGSFQVTRMPQIEVDPKKISVQRFTEDLFGRDVDYPHTLAANSKGMLIWKTEEYEKWEDVMKKLADTYITVRTSFSADGHDDIGERHLLGFPVTNHLADKASNYNWGKNARHASPLRFFVRKREDNYYGFILHIPFGISNRMRKNASGQEFFSPAKQFEIWQKVYQRLDKLCARANIHECL